MFKIIFKILNGGSNSEVEVAKLPNNYNELLKMYEGINTNLDSINSNVIFCINGNSFDQNCNEISYPLQKCNIYHIVVLIKIKKLSQTYNKWDSNVRSTVEGYVTAGSENSTRINSRGDTVNETKFVPKNRLGQETGVSLTFSTGSSVVDKDGNPVNISVQTINGPSMINGFRNVTKD